jgi:hypothetical protein
MVMNLEKRIAALEAAFGEVLMICLYGGGRVIAASPLRFSDGGPGGLPSSGDEWSLLPNDGETEESFIERAKAEARKRSGNRPTPLLILTRERC